MRMRWQVYSGGSSYTRCVWEIKVGLVVSRVSLVDSAWSIQTHMHNPQDSSLTSHHTRQDICIGTFWETNERRKIVSFTSSFDVREKHTPNPEPLSFQP